MNGLLHTLSIEDTKFLHDNDNRLEISKAVDGENISEQANRVGKAINDYITLRNSRIVLSDALSLDEIQSDRWLRTIHDRSRLISPSSLGERITQVVKSPFRTLTKQTNFNENAPKEWLNFIKSKLDLDETFKNTSAFDENGKLDDNEVNILLNNIYENIVQGKTDIFQKTGILKDIEALKKRRRMFFHWKDFNSFSEYNDQYGSGSLFGALMADIHGSSNKIGMADIFGSASEQVYETLKRVQVAQGIDKGKLWHFNTDNLFRWISGESKVAVSMQFATIASNIRAFGSMARLGGIVGQSLTDTNIAASYAQRFGVSYGQAFSNQLNALIGQYTSSELKEFSEMMHFKYASSHGIYWAFC